MGAYEKVIDLAYGENPHQRAAYYAQVGARMHVLSMVRQLGGKELSFNNVLDLNAAPPAGRRSSSSRPARSSSTTTRAGARSAGSAVEAYERAFACDPLSAFGGVIAVNRTVDEEFAEALVKQFGEVVFAPRFTEEALEILAAKPNMRILEDNERRHLNVAERDLKRVMGGLLVQDRDLDLEDRSAMEVVTERKPTEREWGEMLFAWKVCKHVRSNAIVLVQGPRDGRHRRGADEPRRLRAAGDREGPRGGHRPERLSARVRRVLPVLRRPAAGDRRGRDLRSSSRAAPSAIREVVEAADAAGISMVFTHRRHFKH